MSEPRIVAMATFPPRKAGMLTVVNALLPQCDKMYLYLNGYTERPAELPVDPKLQIILAGPGCAAPDLGSHGKFFWCGQEPGYYITVDDDIIYPNGYVEYLVRGVERYGRKAIVSLHGGLYRCAAGGALPPGLAKDHRILYSYDKACPKDMPMHILGCGVMASYPKAIGLSYETMLPQLNSGDDEDIALFSQRLHVPLVKLATKVAWVKPNPKQWVIDPLHRRTPYIQASSQKLRQCRAWRLHPLPPVVNAPIPQPTRNKIDPNSPSFAKILLSDSDRQFCEKIMSSDALAAILIDRIKRKVPTSVIRMSDGESAIITYSQTGEMRHFLKDQHWLRRYGLLGADLAKVGRDLIWAGNEADFLACTISGVFWDCFRVHQHFPKRARFIDQFYPQLWAATDRVGAVLSAGPVLILHREHARLVDALVTKFDLTNVTGMTLDSWQDHERLLLTVAKHPASTVLVSGGASGKPFCVRLAKQTGKVVLDVGEALTGCWIQDGIPGWHDATGRPMGI